MKEWKISVIVPTLQAGLFLPRQLEALHMQNTPPSEIILVDSGSTDDTLEIAELQGCIVENIRQSEFRHGRARNIGARKAQGDVLVFLTQDAVPVFPNFLEQLCNPLEKECAAASAKQIHYPDANPLVIFARHFNYPDQSMVRTRTDVNKLGIKAYFFSNSASAVRRDEFWSVGGFSEEVIVNEDMLLCAQLLKKGASVAYVAEALVYHSHNYSLKKLFKRYFDIGVFFSQSASQLLGAKVESEGRWFFMQAFRALANQHALHWLPLLVAESGVKYLAFQLGRQYRRFSPQICSHFSAQPQYWTGL